MAHIFLARWFKTAGKPISISGSIPDSAKRTIEKSNQPRPFAINRDAHGTRPWHSYKSKQSRPK